MFFRLPFFTFISTLAQLTCRNELGAAVNSWFILKQPAGTQYLYYEPGQNLSSSPYSLNDTAKGALTYTLQQLWTSNMSYALFNDEPATVGENATVAFGHTKGIWAWSDSDAFLLTHSIPLFPIGPIASPTYSGLGANARIYAQTMACFSLPIEELAALAGIATLNVPHIYERRVLGGPSALVAFANGTRRADAICATVIGPQFVYFAKSAQWNNELYSACIAPALSTSLLAETWIRGGATGPACGEYGVLDVEALAFGNVSFRESQDHSKWAVGTTGDAVCVADINRMTSQYKRGGGALCWNDTVLATGLRNAITQKDSCLLTLKGYE
jgi:deoxyribonuclease-2